VNDNAFDAVTRRAAAVSRRRSLRLLGGAGLVSALAAPAAASAAKARKKARNICQKQRKQCRAGFERHCEGLPSCLERSLPCCEHFAQCRVEAGVLCLMNGV
jgi:hypothetical protein